MCVAGKNVCERDVRVFAEKGLYGEANARQEEIKALSSERAALEEWARPTPTGYPTSATASTPIQLTTVDLFSHANASEIKFRKSSFFTR